MGSVWIGFILEVKDLPFNSTFDYSNSCGMNNCPNTKLPEATSKPSLDSIYRLFITLLIATVSAMIISLLFVDDLNYDENLNHVQRQKITKSFISKSNC